MSVESAYDLQALKRIGRIVAQTLQEMAAALKPGMTTRQLDAIGAARLKRHGARSAPSLCYDFPGATCISVNEEVAHGIPGERVVRPGDLVNIDVSAELDGYFADTGASFPVPPVPERINRLCGAGRSALRQAIEAARSGTPIRRIGRTYARVAQREGFTLIRNLSGHGVGRHIHEEPHFVPDLMN
jgi:methionyl aminopeptidase